MGHNTAKRPTAYRSTGTGIPVCQGQEAAGKIHLCRVQTHHRQSTDEDGQVKEGEKECSMPAQVKRWNSQFFCSIYRWHAAHAEKHVFQRGRFTHQDCNQKRIDGRMHLLSRARHVDSRQQTAEITPSGNCNCNMLPFFRPLHTDSSIHLSRLQQTIPRQNVPSLLNSKSKQILCKLF